MESTPQRTSKSTVAGILNIVAGAINLFGLIIVIIMFITVAMVDASIAWDHSPIISPPADGYVRTWNLPGGVYTATAYLLITGVLPLLGGIYALGRRRWGVVLAGSIAAILGPMPLGIAALVFTALSKKKFE